MIGIRNKVRSTDSIGPYATSTSHFVDPIVVGQEEMVPISKMKDNSALASRLGNMTEAVALNPALSFCLDGRMLIERGYLAETSLSCNLN